MASTCLKIFYDSRTLKVSRVVNADTDEGYVHHVESHPEERAFFLPKTHAYQTLNLDQLAQIVEQIETTLKN